MTENYINHIALVLDGSLSMRGKRSTVIKVADDQIKYLARRSQELDQETRVSVYVFGDRVRCVIFDKDVLRLPSIAELYQINGNTALIDATLKSQDDLACTAQLYGDHAFLTYVLTDGEENASARPSSQLIKRLAELPDNWTIGIFVPDQRGVFEAKRCGFPAANIAVWDTTDQGLVEVGETIRRTTDAYMTSRATGVRGSRALFSMGVDTLNAATVRQAGLTQLPTAKFSLLPVLADQPIRDLVEANGHRYTVGAGYYQLTKTENIQANKAIAVRDKLTGAVYTGINARDLLGLPVMDVRVKPDHNPQYDVFVQSTSVNRKLIHGTTLLLLK
jgi:hypothetical protein